MFGFFKTKTPALQRAEAEAPSRRLISQDFLGAIVPVVKAIEFEPSTGQPTSARKIDLSFDDSPVMQDFVADLVIMYAEDKPEVFEFISNRRLRELGLSLEELHARALLNLPSRPPKIELHGEPPKQMVIAGGNFEATLLLYEPLWNQVQSQLSGDILAVAPARDLLFVSDSSWPGARDFLREVSNRELPEPTHLLSRCILRRNGGRWVRDEAAAS